MLLIHRSETADPLVAALGRVLAQTCGDPFGTEVVAVPSKGVERWLAQQLSHVLGAEAGDGVCANVLFPSYARILDEAAAAASSDYADSVEAWSAERSVWPLMRVIDECAPSEPWCRVLAAHLGLDGSGDKGRRFAVAGKLARHFEAYGRSRPAMLRSWHDGSDDQGDGTPLPEDLAWQPELWRHMREAIGHPSPAELLDHACEQLRRTDSDLPDRFSIFGPTRISPSRVQVLAALAEQHEIHLWLHHPSPALWDKVATANIEPRRRALDTLVRNPLLASMSRDVRELQQLLQMAVPEAAHEHHPIGERPATLLRRLQTELADDTVPRERTAIEPDDDSLTIHACHGPARQVEVVREAILQLLADDNTLEPRDVLIMCPDVEAFAPLVAASFGMADEPGGHPAAGLRVKLADRSLRQANPLLSLLSQLLELAASRVTATQLLDLAGASPVRKLFGFDDDDIERLRDWTVAANARWGLDADHRADYGLGNLRQGTWHDAVDRLLLGVAMEEGEQWLADALPLDDVDSGDIDLAGRFAELVDRIDAAVRTINEQRPVPEWTALLGDLVMSLGEPLEPWQAMQLRRELDAVAEAAGDTDVRLGRTDVTVLLQTRLVGRPTRASFRTGTLTVCTLVPMRSVPHRVVCLLGMDDGAFPRQGVADGDDLLAREPRTGERDVRSEDRQLFLDAVCAAQKHLIIAYTGADPRNGAKVPPCVPLGELLDAVDATAQAPGGGHARSHVVVRHPLQPFDRRNFLPAQLGPLGPFSFDPSGLAGARAAASPRHQVPPLVSAPLGDPPPSDNVGLDDLVRFLQHPAKAFLRQRLDVSTATPDDDPDDALTVELDGLQGWAIGERVLQRCMSGTTQRTAAQLERLRGDLPPGPLGNRALRVIGGRVDALLHASEIERRVEARSLEIAVPLSNGRTLSGTVNGVRDHAILTTTYSSLGAKHRLTAWVRYLAVVAMTGDTGYRAIAVGRDRDGARRSILHGIDAPLARRVLEGLVGVRDAGLREPLPLALETSAIYAARRHRNVSAANALANAEQKWEADRFRPERDDPEHVLVFGAGAPLTRLTAAAPNAGEGYPDEPTRFGALARLVWEPLLIVEVDVLP
ncbi:DNA helicase/exodeoxyribonuclease V gamma subunit [Jatrophihabitans sp. GAS493]|uniref:exodeoxyribonuclease V subunit gamma n=1 Tax=Jatrophihabitans sp. GAS493 TaxID=1907575 RepID=UPI000BB6C700|nr:exodeoxyribonuclease V subunit gamma [Jatrophihabitans sp. GAS493]SOD73496.1 DNA helicase/exodeoxyribonuclease V gamma subunit [Jatrophihabitans sp. GAS493]